MRWIRRFFEALLALLILFEEWGWEPLKRALGWVMRWAPLAAIERVIVRLPPWAALVVFFLPTLLLLPIKMGALWLIAKGQKLLGLLVIVGAKIVGTALVARLFHLTQPALMTLPWFARLYARWTVWKEALLASVRASWAWRVGRVVKRRIAMRVARWRGA